MDTLSHALWGGVLFGRASRGDFGLAFLLGAGPDLVSFGPAFAGWAAGGFKDMRRKPGEPPPMESIPRYVVKIYDVTHSLLVSGAVYGGLWWWRGRPPWVLGAWIFHILCDIPTHTRKFFPTPYLWPLKTPYVNGFRWAVTWFMALNYSALAAAYLWTFVPLR
jgi:hypothetical protein